jgi:hypothetical protein
MLKLIFEFIEPRRGRNWFSRRLARWKINNHNKDNSLFEANNEEGEFFNVAGAGKIFIGEGLCYTGGAAGFDIGISWGRYGYTGGVLGLSEAKRLAEYLLNECSEYNKTEDELIEENKIQREEYFKSLEHE